MVGFVLVRVAAGREHASPVMIGSYAAIGTSKCCRNAVTLRDQAPGFHVDDRKKGLDEHCGTWPCAVKRKA
jgi:hypothetical protein